MELAGLVLLLVGLLLGLGAGLVVGTARGRTGAARTAAERDAALAERARVTEERDQVALRAAHAETSAAALAAELDAERRAQGELPERFKALSQEALDRTSERLVALTDERLKAAERQSSAELEKREAAVQHLVRPLQESLTKVERQMADVEKARAEAYGDLRRQVQTMNETSGQLRLETAQLVTALRAPQVRGRWGELQLRRVVEVAGMLEHVDFVEQEHLSTDDGALRPDLIVKLAGGKQVVVDAKVAFSGYLEAMEAREESVKAERLKAHARHLRTHIDQLGAKAYWEHVTPSPEFVVMFVPAEAFLDAALAEEPALLEHAFSQNVVIATPSTLVALLRTIAYTWRQDALAANAQQVYLVGRELHGRLATLGGHVAKLGSQLNGAVTAYNKTVSSLESRVLVSARRLAELKVTDEELATPAQLEVRAVVVQAPELVASAEDFLVLLDDIETDRRYGVDARASRTPGSDEPLASAEDGRSAGSLGA